MNKISDILYVPVNSHIKDLPRYLDGRNGSRAKYGGFDAIDQLTGENMQGRDCKGHGTHCAGIAAGLYSGVAKDANLFSIRVLSCTGSGSVKTIINGMKAVRRRHRENMDRYVTMY